MKEQDEHDHRYHEKTQEIIVLQKKMKEMEIQHSVNIENIHIKLTEERNSDVEQQYQVLIEQLYVQIADWEKKYHEEIHFHQEKYSKLEIKHAK